MAAAQKVLFRNRTVLVFCLCFYALLKFFLVVRRHHLEEQMELGNIPSDYDELKNHRSQQKTEPGVHISVTYHMIHI